MLIFSKFVNAYNPYLTSQTANLFGKDGNDFIYGTAKSEYFFLERGNDTAYGDGGDDFLYGYAGNDVLYGGFGKDYLFGGADNDTLYGGRDDDNLWGEAGRDYLSGDAGNDGLSGGAGADVLTGGANNDVFAYAAASDSFAQAGWADIITDFNASEDRIDIPQGPYVGGFNYAERATTATSIDEAAFAVNNMSLNTPDIVFMYNPVSDIGFLMVDVDQNNHYEFGITLLGAGSPSDFSIFNLM